METMPSRELLEKWRVEYAADLDVSLAEIKRRALEEFDRKWSKDTEGSNAPLQIAPTMQQEPVKPPRKAIATSNGSSSRASRVPTIKQMILSVLPEPGETFTSSYIKAEILKMWPDAEGKYLGSRISKVLKEWLDSGTLEKVSKGARIQDPIVYRLKESDKETLLDP